MMDLFEKSAFRTAKVVTNLYSTSFSMGIMAMDSKYRDAIYGVYGFVRYADEIVDTFHDKDKEALLDKFQQDTYDAIAQGISLNPVLHAFQLVVNKYNIEKELIDAFLLSMRMDIVGKQYDNELYNKYIYGSAEVVGLMCLRIFTNCNEGEYNNLRYAACKLGAAFQKVNFLRDMQSDYVERGRVYFPGVDFHHFTPAMKQWIEDDIQKDFDRAFEGIIKLPKGARFGVYLAYIYYKALFHKIRKLTPQMIMQKRIRISGNLKLLLFAESYFKTKLNLI